MSQHRTAVDAPKTTLKIAVLGSGAFGTALGYCAARNGHEVVIVSRQKEVVAAINEKRVHPSRLVRVRVCFGQFVCWLLGIFWSTDD